VRPQRDAIERAFSRAVHTYDAHSTVQREAAESVAMLLKKTLEGADPPLRILDAGCGTGRLAEFMGREFPESEIYGCDISLPMLEAALDAARLRAGRIARSACEALPFAERSFSAVASSLAYQWSPDPAAAFNEAARVLAPDGALVFSTLGPATLFELRECIGRRKRLMEYAGVELVRAWLEGAGLEALSVESTAMVKTYADLPDLMRTLKRVGASAQRPPGSEPLTIKEIREAQLAYAERFATPEGRIRATYEVILASAKKPKGQG